MLSISKLASLARKVASFARKVLSRTLKVTSRVEPWLQFVIVIWAIIELLNKALALAA